MKIELNKNFAPNSTVDAYDVRQMKRALNRLGYYMPPKDAGITDIVDGAVFSALKKFQKERGLRATGTARPEDETISTINEALEEKPEGTYIWRTAKDDKVRPEHEELEGTVRSYADSPLPGEDYNCRCWQERPEEEPEGLSQVVVSDTSESDHSWTIDDFRKHFWSGEGRGVTLPEAGLLNTIIERSKQLIFKNLESQIEELMQSEGEGPLYYDTVRDYDYESVVYAIGNAVVSTETIGQVTESKNLYFIDAQVTYAFFDEITDPFDLREFSTGTSSTKDENFSSKDWSEFGGTAFEIKGTWVTNLTGSIKKTQ